MSAAKFNTAKVEGKEYVLLPKKEYEALVKDLEQLEDAALGKLMKKQGKDEYVSVDTFLKKARQRITRLKAARKK